MAEWFPRAGKRQSGGTKMISNYRTSRDTTAAETAMPENPIPAIKKEPWNGFPRQKNFPNTSDATLACGWRNTIENRGGNITSVTTSHLFQPNQRRNVGLSLRFWLPNSSLPTVNVTPQWPWGRGGQMRASGANALIEKALRKFCLIGPLPCSVRKNVGACDLATQVSRGCRPLTCCLSSVHHD